MTSIIQNIIDTINTNRKFIITAHDNLDGDSIGSELALALALKKIGKDAVIFLTEQIPGKYRFLSQIADVKFIKKCRPLPSCIFFVLDTAGWDQIKKAKNIRQDKCFVINIDHHIDNKKFGHINWIDPKSSAVGEQIYELITNLGIELTTDISTCLYTAILTDTGSFQFSNTTSKTHSIISKLLTVSITPNIISTHVYENISPAKLKLLQKMLATVKMGNNIIWAWITRKMLKESRANIKETEGFIDFLKMVKGIRVALIFKEYNKKGEIRITFRSKDSRVAVNEIAHQFNGGGHPAAAGATVYGRKKQVEKQVLNAVKKALETTRK